MSDELLPVAEFSAVVGMVYDCALDPARWPDAIGAVRRGPIAGNRPREVQRFFPSKCSPHRQSPDKMHAGRQIDSEQIPSKCILK
jgi:hypothetical protein